ncbi:MAG TPA: peptide chain release factor N(5)-glutamine methyltransferase [Verrucomicrobiales bacterium]|nr:peptide chain release factor N(5)-glutamine methyltransferase [Verrucomicrobiales bacterium]|tara:strand:- start:505 stop:1344 length:840 start_codon:yes stop_codon:yes gene_type:complete
MKTVLECLERGSSYLQEKGVEGARRNMEWLLAQQLACSRIELYASFDRPMTEQELVPLRALLKRRGQGEPLQHLLGTVEFAGREFQCDHRALIPRPETEEMVESALKLEMGDQIEVLDVGTGSGVIGITIGLSLGERCAGIVLTDISRDALTLAQENADRHALTVTCLEGDLCEGVRGTYNLILANLPYIPIGEKGTLSPEVGYDPETALFAGPDGLDLLRRFLPTARNHLASGGWLALEIGANQGPEVVRLAQSSGLNSIRLDQDLSGKPRFVFAQAP